MHHSAPSSSLISRDPAPHRSSADAPTLVFGALVWNIFIGVMPVVFSKNYGNEAALTGSGDALRQVSFVLIFLTSAVIAIRQRGLSQLWSLPASVGIIVLWSWLSLSWAIEPTVAFRRVMLNTLVIMAVFFCVSSLGPRRFLSQLTAWCAILLFANWASILLFPHAKHGAEELDQALIGNWRGIFTTKNETGAFCVVSILLFMHATLRSRSFIVGPALILLAIIFLIMTASKTSTALLVVAIIFGALITAAYRNPVLRAVLLGICTLTALTASVFLADEFFSLFSFLDDPMAFTGRTMLWNAALDFAYQNLFFGAGYGSFWAIGANSPILWHPSEWVTEAINAHSGYFDILIQLGLPGLALVIVFFILRPIAVLATQRIHPVLPRWLLGAIIIFFIFHNLLETSFMDRASSFWFFFLAALLLTEPRWVHDDRE